MGLTPWICSDVRTSWNQVSNSSGHKISFRNDFWFKTVARFYALYEYQKSDPKTPLLHVEADVWLSPSFPMQIISEIQGKIAYPLKNLSEGIASTLYISDLGISEALIDFSEKCFRTNPLSTDVSILGSFHLDSPELFENLPTLPLSFTILQEPSSPNLPESLNRNFEKFHGIFDSSSLGIHFTGVDPRNNWGVRTLFSSPVAPMDLNKVVIEIEGGFPFLVYEDRRIEVFSLHIHSKDLRWFYVESYLSRLYQISRYDQRKKKHELIGFDSLAIFSKTLLLKVLLILRQKYRSLK